MATITTSTGLGLPADKNLGATPLHPSSGPQGAPQPASFKSQAQDAPGNAGLNDPVSGEWNSLAPTVSDPSKLSS